MITTGTQRVKSVIASLNGSLFQARVCNFCRGHIIWCELIYLRPQSFDYNQGHPTTVSIKSTLRSLEMHFERRYKICTCQVILRELESFRNYKGFSIIFPKILDAIELVTKVTSFLIPLHTFLNPKVLGIHFCTKNSLTWAVKCEKLNLENRRKFIK